MRALNRIVHLLIVSAAASSAAALQTVASEGVFREITFEEALAAAKEEKKVVFVDFFTTWCGPCKKLDTTTWVDEKVVAWLGENTIPLKIDAEIETELAKKYRVRAYPTMVFIDPDGKQRGRLVGYATPEKFLVQAPKRLAGRTELDEVEERITDSEKDPMLRSERGSARARAGRHKEALADFLYCFDEGVNSPGYTGVRLSFLLSNIVNLGASYPPALDALQERAEAATRRLTTGEGSQQDALDVSALNRSLKQRGKTLELYDAFHETEGANSAVEKILFEEVIDLLLEAERYQDVLDGTGDVLEAFRASRKRFDEMKSYLAGEEFAAAIRQMRRSATTKASQHYTALLGVENDELAAELAEELIDFDPTGATFGVLATAAIELERDEVARAFLTRGFATVDQSQRAPLKRANRRLPREKRVDVP